jgi:Leu/Phe-tRNA-protein transferase
MTTYPYIGPEHLTPEIIERIIYPNLELTDFLSDCWSPEFYVALARAGFISIDFGTVGQGHLLLAALHGTYAVLDWKDLHVSGQVKKLVRRHSFVEDGTYLVIDKSTESVIEGIQASYGPGCWLTRQFKNLMKELESYSENGFSVLSVQLWSGRQNRMLGGELGYTIGKTYTSLTGFLDRTNPESNNRGSVQLVALAKLLEKNGYAFWNLGQSFMEYKIKLGAKVTPRPEFLSRWIAARDLEPAMALERCAGTFYPCHNLITN